MRGTRRKSTYRIWGLLLFSFSIFPQPIKPTARSEPSRARIIWCAWMHGFCWYYNYNALAYNHGLKCWLPCWLPPDNHRQRFSTERPFFGFLWRQMTHFRLTVCFTLFLVLLLLLLSLSHSRTVFGDRNYTVYNISEQLRTPVSNDFLSSRMCLPVSLHPISLSIADKRCNPPGPIVPFHFVYSWRFELSFVGLPKLNGSQWD